MQQPDPRIRKITTTTVFINGVQQGPPTVTTSMQQQRPKVIITDTVPQSWIVNAGVPPPPTGNAPARKTPAPPPARTPGGTAMHWIPAALIRIALGLAGVAFYTGIFFIVAAFLVFYYGAQIFTENLVYRGAATKFYSQRLDKWQNRVMWMWIDGFIATIKFIFTGGNTDLLREFFRHGIGKPLIRISKQYWDQEFRRL